MLHSDLPLSASRRTTCGIGLISMSQCYQTVLEHVKLPDETNFIKELRSKDTTVKSEGTILLPKKCIFQYLLCTNQAKTKFNRLSKKYYSEISKFYTRGYFYCSAASWPSSAGWCSSNRASASAKVLASDLGILCVFGTPLSTLMEALISTGL